MDDLSSLDWSQTKSQVSSKPSVPGSVPGNTSSSYPSLRPTPSPLGSGRNTPQFTTHGSGPFKPAAVPVATKASQDSFSNLLSFGSSKPDASLSLRERQEKLEAEKRRQDEAKKQQTANQFGNGQFWDALESRVPAISPFPGGVASPASAIDDHDLFAAFKAETRVDNASHYPPPLASKPTTPALDLTEPGAWQSPTSNTGKDFENDDDPFGLNQFRQKAPAPPPVANNSEDEDFLGDLGLSVDEVRRKRPPPPPPPPPPQQQQKKSSGHPLQPGKQVDSDESGSSDEEAPPPPRRKNADPFNKAVAELCDFGFSVEDARRGLENSGAGINVQAAVNWLLDDAHDKAKKKTLGRQTSGSRERQSRMPAGEAPSQTRGSRSTSRPGLDGDLSQTAAAMGANFLKTANTIWKTGQKKVQQAVADLQQEGGDPNQPKWMRSAQQGTARSSGKAKNVTDEALMLESDMGMESGSNRNGRRTQQDPRQSREQSPSLSAPSSGRSTPKWQQAALGAPAAAAGLDSRSRLSRLSKADDELPSYSSPHRRRTPQSEPSKPKPVPKQEEEILPEVDLLNTSEAKTLPQRPFAETQAKKRPVASAAPKPAVPKITRNVPPISHAALSNSTRHRLEGTSHFKRGDFVSAHASYSSSIDGVPPSHPLIIVLLTNRALTNLKTGSAKEAIDDADAALRVIGPGGGHGETVMVATETGGVEEKREMRDLYGKALSRKAEALEQMERWSDAFGIWKTCVEAGVGGAVAIQGRQRCQTALAPKPKAKPKPTPAATAARPKPSSAASSLAPPANSAAVERLRLANADAVREDDEKFALNDQVDARVSAWRDGKTDNLRALLGSLDNVLWEGSGWKKIGLHELVMAGKVKVSYMKAIAKTHPDKLPQDANTEVRLIAAAVFSTLNESWDKFKADNGL